MIPSMNNILSEGLEMGFQPSRTYQMYVEGDVISGTCNKLDAMHQAIYKILSTERYENIIYSWNYGIELLDLYGQPTSKVCSELQERITEALLQDDRIQSVDSFEFDVSQKKTVKVTFTVHTIFGELKEEKVVNV